MDNFISFLSTFPSLFRNKPSIPIDYIREQHHKIIVPMFSLLSPVLYQNNLDIEKKTDILEKCHSIFDDNKKLADADLYVLFIDYTSDKIDDFDFQRLCCYVDQKFDQTSKQLGLRLRTYEDRKKLHHYIDAKHLKKFEPKHKEYVETIKNSACLAAILLLFTMLRILLQPDCDTEVTTALYFGIALVILDKWYQAIR